MTDTKIRDSKGNIYNSCPFINKIIQFLDNPIENANVIKVELEKVRAINAELREESIAEEYKNKIDEYKDKLKIVEDYLGVHFEGHWEKWFESNIKEIADKIKELEKENEELKEEINNLTNN
jgi:hypothetical protein